tara:strand:+ start:383 stop:835 length:453 start_codon:yes stop_codon:yes gene_type:complete
MNWDEAQEIWSTVRNPSRGKPLGNNTRLYPKVGYSFLGELVVISYEIQLHGNTIITVFPDDSQVLDSCGWKTVTTKERINKWGLTETYTIPNTNQKTKRYYLLQKDYSWYLEDMKLNTITEFYDGMYIYSDSADNLTQTPNTLNFPEGFL